MRKVWVGNAHENNVADIVEGHVRSCGLACGLENILTLMMG